MAGGSKGLGTMKFRLLTRLIVELKLLNQLFLSHFHLFVPAYELHEVLCFGRYFGFGGVFGRR